MKTTEAVIVHLGQTRDTALHSTISIRCGGRTYTTTLSGMHRIWTHRELTMDKGRWVKSRDVVYDVVV